jgi:hypothetical protein
MSVNSPNDSWPPLDPYKGSQPASHGLTEKLFRLKYSQIANSFATWSVINPARSFFANQQP